MGTEGNRPSSQKAPALPITPRAGDVRTLTHAPTHISAISAVYQDPTPPIPATNGPTTSASTLMSNRPSSQNPNNNSKSHQPRVKSHVDPDRFDSLLLGFPKREYVVSGFKGGFKTHFQGIDCPLTSHNSTTTKLNPEAVDNMIQQELLLERIGGPSDTPPMKNFKSSPLSIREKSTPGQFRLLHNLLFPYNDQSVNSNIPQQFKTVQYSTILDAIKIIQSYGKGACMAKSDIKSAFRIVPLHPSEYHRMGFKWRNKFYYDKFLAMGHSEACRIFETISDALLYILNNTFKITSVVKIIDDFLFIGSCRRECEHNLNIFLNLCEYLGVPIAYNKTTMDPTTTIEFLGIELDTQAMVARLPVTKLNKYSTQIRDVLEKRSVRVSDLRTLIGRLQFSTSVVTVGRPFLRRLIDLSTLSDKPYWHLKISNNVAQDLKTWLSFLEQYNGVTIIRQREITQSNAINLHSDASKLGYAATYKSHWLQGMWSDKWKGLNIAVLELYPILLTIQVFGQSMANSSVIFYCDNEAIVHVINKQTSKDKNIMCLLRPLVLALLKFNIKFKSVHIPTQHNHLSDAISRFQITPQLLQSYGMQPLPTPTPHHLRPEVYIH